MRLVVLICIIEPISYQYAFTSQTEVFVVRKTYQSCCAVRIDNNGVTWIDDSKATNVEATYSGLMGVKQKAVLLLGGIAKVL